VGGADEGGNRVGIECGACFAPETSIDAAAFYCNAFHMMIGYNVKHDNGTYLHTELEKDGNSIFAVSESNDELIKNAMLSADQPTMSLGINLNNDEELHHAYQTLIKEGHILRPLGALPWSPCSADVVDL